MNRQKSGPAQMTSNRTIPSNMQMPMNMVNPSSGPVQNMNYNQLSQSAPAHSQMPVAQYPQPMYSGILKLTKIKKKNQTQATLFYLLNFLLLFYFNTIFLFKFSFAGNMQNPIHHPNIPMGMPSQNYMVPNNNVNQAVRPQGSMDQTMMMQQQGVDMQDRNKFPYNKMNPMNMRGMTPMNPNQSQPMPPQVMSQQMPSQSQPMPQQQQPQPQQNVQASQNFPQTPPVKQTSNSPDMSMNSNSQANPGKN